MPRLTVLMCVYNGMPFLPDAVQSILQQTYQDWNFIIVNDGSTDGTAEWLAQLSDPRIRVLHQANAGPAAASNHGLKYCETEYLARMDADDISHPDRLRQQIQFLDEHPQVGLLGTQFSYFGSRRSAPPSRLPTDHATIDAELMRGRHAMCNGGSMCRTAVLKKVGGFWADGIAEDWDMFLRVAEAAELANLDECLYSVRVHSQSLNARRMTEMRLRIAYSCDRAERRRRGQPPVLYDEFCDRRHTWWRAIADRVDGYAMLQYRRAIAEQLGHQAARGRLRLAWAAACGPHLTQQRLLRLLRHWSRVAEPRHLIPAGAAAHEHN